MIPLDRRQALAGVALLGGAAWGAPGSADECPATYPETAGEGVAPGVREVFQTRVDVAFAGYGTIWVSDLVFQRGAVRTEDVLHNDMIILMAHGLLRVRESGWSLMLKRGAVWAFPKGVTVELRNSGAEVAVARVIDLLPGLGPKAHPGAATAQ